MVTRACVLILVIASLCPVASAADPDGLQGAYERLKDHPDPSVQRRAQSWHELTKSRQWQDASGEHSIEARYIDYDPQNESVTIETPQGKRITLSIQKLSERDNKVVASIQKLKPSIVAELQKARESSPAEQKADDAEYRLYDTKLRMQSASDKAQKTSYESHQSEQAAMAAESTTPNNLRGLDSRTGPTELNPSGRLGGRDPLFEMSRRSSIQSAQNKLDSAKASAKATEEEYHTAAHDFLLSKQRALMLRSIAWKKKIEEECRLRDSVGTSIRILDNDRVELKYTFSDEKQCRDWKLRHLDSSANSLEPIVPSSTGLALHNAFLQCRIPFVADVECQVSLHPTGADQKLTIAFGNPQSFHPWVFELPADKLSPAQKPSSTRPSKSATTTPHKTVTMKRPKAASGTGRSTQPPPSETLSLKADEDQTVAFVLQGDKSQGRLNAAPVVVPDVVNKWLQENMQEANIPFGSLDGLLFSVSTPDSIGITEITLRGHLDPSWLRALTASPLAKEVAVLKGHSGPVIRVVASPDGALLASCSEDRTIKLWDTKTHTNTHTLVGHQRPVIAIAFSPDGKTLATVGADENAIRVWDVAAAQERKTITEGAEGVSAVAISPDGKFLAGNPGDTVTLWDLTTGGRIATLATDRWPGKADGLTFCSRNILACSKGNAAMLWNISNAKHVFLHTDNDCSGILTVSVDSRTLAVAAGESPITLWSPQACQQRTFLSPGGHDAYIHNFAPHALAFSPDGKILASADRGGTITLWNTRGGERRGSFKAHEGGTWSVAFLPDGKTLVSGGMDNTIKIWDLATDR